MRLLLILVTLLVTAPALAIVEQPDVRPEDFSSPEQKQRFRALVEDLRCTVCQNQNVADSHASLARDIRHQVLDLMKQGKSDEEVVNFLVARYGNYVRYRPPFNAQTAILWLGPFIFLGIAIWALLKLIRQRSRQRPDAALSNEEQAALQATLQSLQQTDETAGADK
ncbi:MAG TPA: cytochrome c-type biogenesis protein CcmH [Gammaproteobacteria bacterium]|nr:cytochrome c-type biogenesis protein CcmH [Gammaproteobacteria bacterium]